MAAFGRFKPGIEPRPGPPGRFNDGGQAPVAPADEVLHRREAPIGVIGFEAPKGLEGLAQQLLAPLEFSAADAVPLEGGVGFGGEIADGEIQLQATQVAALLLQAPAGGGNCEDIGIGFPRQADDEIQLDLAVAGLHRRADALQEFSVGQTFVDDVAQALAAGLGGEGEAGPTGAAEDVGNIGIEAVDPLAGQGEADVVFRQAIAQFDANGGQGQVIGTTERQQGEIGIAGAVHALLHRFDHRLGLHIPGGAGEHAGLAEAAATGAAAADFNREAIVNCLDVGHQAHGVVGHRRGRAPQQASWQSGLQGDHADPIRPGSVKGGHVDARHLGKVTQQVGAAEAGGPCFGHHQANLWQQFFTIAEGDEIKEGGEGLRVAGGGGSAGKDQGRRRRVGQGQVAPLGGPQGNAGQIQHLQDVGGAQLVAEAEAEDVKGAKGAAAFDREQGQISLPQPGRQIGRRQVGAIAELAGNAVENRIENDVAQVAGPHLVDLGVGEGPAHTGFDPGLRPIARLDAEFVAQVAAGFEDIGTDQGLEVDGLAGLDGCEEHGERGRASYRSYAGRAGAGRADWPRVKGREPCKFVLKLQKYMVIFPGKPARRW